MYGHKMLSFIKIGVFILALGVFCLSIADNVRAESALLFPVLKGIEWTQTKPQIVQKLGQPFKQTDMYAAWNVTFAKQKVILFTFFTDEKMDRVIFAAKVENGGTEGMKIYDAFKKRVVKFYGTPATDNDFWTADDYRRVNNQTNPTHRGPFAYLSTWKKPGQPFDTEITTSLGGSEGKETVVVDIRSVPVAATAH